MITMTMDEGVMESDTIQRNVIVRNPHGFHVRPAAAFAEAAARFESQVTIIKEDMRVDGRRPLDMMMLGAEPGTELILEVAGPDASAAIDTLAEILEASDPPGPPVPKKG